MKINSRIFYSHGHHFRCNFNPNSFYVCIIIIIITLSHRQRCTRCNTTCIHGIFNQLLQYLYKCISPSCSSERYMPIIGEAIIIIFSATRSSIDIIIDIPFTFTTSYNIIIIMRLVPEPTQGWIVDK